MTVVNATLHLGIGSVTVIHDVEVELELHDLWLVAVTIEGVRITGNTVAAHGNPLAIAIWTAAIGWVDANTALIDETAHDQRLARKETEHERRRQYAA